jgi:Astacin (Peptidase family M12A)
MQSATNRDQYVRIEFDKIQAGTENNFNTYGFDVITDYSVEYDYGTEI